MGKSNGDPRINPEELRNRMSRRAFLAGVGTLGAGVAATGLIGCGGEPQQREGSAAASETALEAAVIEELPIPEAEAPTTTEYECDVLVVGAGYTGIPAAVEAKQSGARVILVDKGYPGYSGLSPFPQCYQFFSEEYGDNRQFQRDVTLVGGEYIANVDWYDVYLDESEDCYNQLVEWGVFTKYDNASVAGDYYDTNRQRDYYQEQVTHDRRRAWRDVLSDFEIDTVPYTMIADVIVEDGRVVGAIGLDNKTATPITFHAKSVILCTGTGVFRNTGYPLSGDTFDAEWIGYHLGLPVTGKEWEHIEATSSLFPSSSWRNYSWGYMENLHEVAGKGATSSEEEMAAPVLDSIADMLSWSSITNRVRAAQNGIEPITLDQTSGQSANHENMDEGDSRWLGNDVDKMPSRNVIGGAVGMGIFHCSGVYCPDDSDLVGYTGIPGLYVAGNAHASMTYGAVYTPGEGGSIPLCHIQGRRAAKAASEYAEGVELVKISDGALAAKRDELLAPMSLEKGLDVNWAREVLYSAMAPYWVSVAKSEKSLTAALYQIEMLRDNVEPILLAKNPHELRLVHEFKHRLLSAEMKIRANLERKESRGSSYRSDYPYRDDENYLCYITLSKGEDGQMVVGKAPVKDEFKGDLSLPYTRRYPSRYPGELKALGIEEEAADSSGSGR